MRQAIEQMAGLLHQLSTLPLEQVSLAHKLASGGNRIASTPLETIWAWKGQAVLPTFAALANC
jgi:hypothetical protein